MDGFRQLSAATPCGSRRYAVVIIGIDENDIKAVGDYQFQTEIWQNAQNSPELQAKGNWSRYV